ncbi:MAG: serine hydrolase [Cyclobacteriaceae bacterium]
MTRSCFFILALLASAQIFAIDSLSIARFFDQKVPAQMDHLKTAGAVVAVVQNGEIVFQKGYGLSDVEEGVKMDPENSLMRIGSISKVFVWLSVMKLVEQGALELDRDVETYIDFEMKGDFDEPITLRHIMSHTAGLEDYVIKLFSNKEKDLKGLAEILDQHFPERVRPPGEFVSYSNHATGLAALIVEQVSGKNWKEFIKQEFFDPMNMNQSSFDQPLSQELQSQMSKGYLYGDGEFVAQSFELIPLYPIGAMSATASDMAKLMSTLLNYGNVDSVVKIMDSTTLAQMYEVSHQHTAEIDAMRHGFMDFSQNGYTVFGHGGDTFWFHSAMALIPEANTGLFVSVNTGNMSGTLALKLMFQFMDEFFPEKEDLQPPINIDFSTLSEYEGVFRSIRFPNNRYTKLTSLQDNIQVNVEGEGLRIKTMFKDELYVPIGSDKFREETSSELMVFERDTDGEITTLYNGMMPVTVYERIPNWLSPASIGIGFGSSALIIILTFIGWGIYLIVRFKDEERLLTVLRVSFFGTFAFVLFIIMIMIAFSNPLNAVYGVPPLFRFALFLPLIIGAYAIYMIYAVIDLWGQQISVLVKLHYSLLTISFVVVTLFFYHFKMIGWNF